MTRRGTPGRRGCCECFDGGPGRHRQRSEHRGTSRHRVVPQELGRLTEVLDHADPRPVASGDGQRRETGEQDRGQREAGRVGHQRSDRSDRGKQQRTERPAEHDAGLCGDSGQTEGRDPLLAGHQLGQRRRPAGRERRHRQPGRERQHPQGRQRHRETQRQVDDGAHDVADDEHGAAGVPVAEGGEQLPWPQPRNQGDREGQRGQRGRTGVREHQHGQRNLAGVVAEVGEHLCPPDASIARGAQRCTEGAGTDGERHGGPPSDQDDVRRRRWTPLVRGAGRDVEDAESGRRRGPPLPHSSGASWCVQFADRAYVSRAQERAWPARGRCDAPATRGPRAGIGRARPYPW